MTKKYHGLSIVFGLLSFISVWGPAVYAILSAFANGDASQVNKFSIGATAIVAGILCLVSAVLKYHWRTPAVLVLIGIYFFTKNFAAILLLVGLGIITDEIILTPLHKHYKNLYTINKQIDIRQVA